MDESEPWRCRRTDGKKWRCKKEVIQNEKYCEKHMHRGCRRGSRKLVEYSPYSSSNKLTLSCATTTTNTTTAAPNHSSNNKYPTSNHIKPKPNESRPNFVITSPKSSSPLSLQLKIHPPNNTAHHYEKIAVAKVREEVNNKGSSDDCQTTKSDPVTKKIEVKSAAVSDSVVKERVNLSKKSGVMSGDGSCCDEDEVVIIIDDDNTKTKSRNGVTASSSALDFSPKSVLRDGQVSSSPSQLNQKNSADLNMQQSLSEFDPQRCRRTDGKRWQCSKEVVASGEKYCAQHMHRGAKKRPIVVVSPYGSNNGGGKVECGLCKQAKNGILSMDN